jgi:hypothetical protein
VHVGTAVAGVLGKAGDRLGRRRQGRRHQTCPVAPLADETAQRSPAQSSRRAARGRSPGGRVSPFRAHLPSRDPDPGRTLLGRTTPGTRPCRGRGTGKDRDAHLQVGGDHRIPQIPWRYRGRCRHRCGIAALPNRRRLDPPHRQTEAPARHARPLRRLQFPAAQSHRSKRTVARGDGPSRITPRGAGGPTRRAWGIPRGSGVPIFALRHIAPPGLPMPQSPIRRPGMGPVRRLIPGENPSPARDAPRSPPPAPRTPRPKLGCRGETMRRSGT